MEAGLKEDRMADHKGIEAETQKRENENRKQLLAQKIWSLSRDRLLMNLRFLDVALSSLAFQAREAL